MADRTMNKTNDTNTTNPTFPADMSPEQTIIGAKATIRGEVTLAGDALICGGIEGRLDVGGTVTIGPDSRVDASVCCEDLILEGAINGDVAATGGLILATGATLIGDVMAAEVQVPSGAAFQGSLQIGTPTTSRPATPKATTTNGKTQPVALIETSPSDDVDGLMDTTELEELVSNGRL